MGGVEMSEELNKTAEEKLKELTGKDVEIEDVPGGFKVLWCDFNKKARLAPMGRSVEEAVDNFTQWYKENYNVERE